MINICKHLFCYISPMKNVLLVALGGALGAAFRYLLSLCITSAFFPWQTFLVNISGCFLIGLVWSMNQEQLLNKPLFLFITTGLLGGYTTFSAFGLETVTLFNEGKKMIALIYCMASTIVGLLMVFIASHLYKLFS